MNPDLDESDYLLMGNYHVTEAKRLMRALEAACVRFWIDMDDSGIKEMNPFVAAYGGTFGQGVDLRVYVHPDDQERFHECHRDVFDPEPLPKRVTLRDRLRSR